MIEYLTSCPSCGAELSPHVGSPDSAPWICNACHLGFWACELLEDARQIYRAWHRDFGVGSTSSLRIARVHELEAAEARGTSAREDQISLLSAAQLATLLNQRRLDPRLRKLAENENARRQQTGRAQS